MVKNDTRETKGARKVNPGLQMGFDPLDLTVEQFMSLEVEEHTFSENYQQRKEALLRAVSEKRSSHVRQWRMPKVAVAAIVAACIALPAGAYAVASHTDFFDGAFGTGWRSSHQPEEMLQDQDGDKLPCTVVYPGSEAAPVDQEMAERLLGSAMYSEPLTITSPDGHVLTIESLVRSDRALVYSFTLAREGGVTALEWNDQTNNVAAKGAYTPLDQQMSWSIAGDEFLYIDPTTSTADELHGYGYSVFGAAVPKGKSLNLTVYTCDAPFNEDFSEDQFHEDHYTIPCKDVVESLDFENGEGGVVEVSPLGLSLDSRTGLFPKVGKGEYDRAQDPVNILAILVNLEDGSSYSVWNSEANLDNSLSACLWSDGGRNPQLTLAFNRLVDPAQVTSVEVTVVDGLDEEKLDKEGNYLPQGQWPQHPVTYTR